MTAAEADALAARWIADAAGIIQLYLCRRGQQTAIGDKAAKVALRAAQQYRRRHPNSRCLCCREPSPTDVVLIALPRVPLGGGAVRGIAGGAVCPACADVGVRQRIDEALTGAWPTMRLSPAIHLLDGPGWRQ